MSPTSEVPSLPISGVLIETGFVSEGTILTNEGVVNLWNRLEEAGPWPLYYTLDDRLIGYISNLILDSGRGHKVTIFFEAVIDDAELLSNPGLIYGQIVRGAFWHSLDLARKQE